VKPFLRLDVSYDDMIGFVFASKRVPEFTGLEIVQYYLSPVGFTETTEEYVSGLF